MKRIDVTLECRVALQTPADGNNPDGTPIAPTINDVGAVVFIFHRHVTIGILDLTGFHQMDPPAPYVVENSYMASSGISWFKVYKVITDGDVDDPA